MCFYSMIFNYKLVVYSGGQRGLWALIKFKRNTYIRMLKMLHTYSGKGWLANLLLQNFSKVNKKIQSDSNT